MKKLAKFYGITVLYDIATNEVTTIGTLGTILFKLVMGFHLVKMFFIGAFYGFFGRDFTATFPFDVYD